MSTPAAAARAALVQYLVDLMKRFGPVQARAMFGGHGLYREGLMFALVLDERLYFKVDDQNQAAFDQQGLKPFSYVTKAGKTGQLRYHEAPAEAYEDMEAMAAWAQRGYEAALRAQAGQGAKSGRRKATSSKGLAACAPLVTADCAALRNLGPASQAMLARAGIRSAAQLRELGSVRAYLATRRVCGSQASLNLLWALEGALSNRPWQQVAETDRVSLLMALEDLERLAR